MQYIDIFLASSIDDLHNERMELGNYIRVLNDMYQGRGIYFRLHMCEDISDELSTKRSQEIYNDVIRQCDYFYIMCWHKAGEYTLEEFDVALKQFTESGKAPKITTFFKQIDEPAEAVRKFMERLDGELQHYYTVFDSIDSVKLKILLEMAQRPELQMQVACQDAKLTLNGQEVKDIHMDKLPFYANHDKITELRERLEQLNKDFIDVKLEIAADPQNDELLSKRNKLSGEKNKAEEELHKLEMELIGFASKIVEITSDGRYLTMEAKKAIELFEQGHLDKALAVLSKEQIYSDIDYALKKDDLMKREIEGSINSLKIRIDILKSKGIDSESAKEITELYEKMEATVIKSGLDKTCLIDYMNFLVDQRDYQKALKKGKQLYHYFKSTDIDDDTWAQFCNDYANLYSDTNCYEEAEKLYNEALEIYRRLAKHNLQAYGPVVATTYNNLANLYKNTNRYEEAEKLYNKSLEIRSRLAKDDPQAYEPDVATTCNNFAVLYDDTNRYDEAEKLYNKALEIRRRLAKDNPQAYESYVAITCNNLAALYGNTNLYDKADELYNEALEIYRRSAKDNPQTYEPYLAGTCNNLAALYDEINSYEEAEKLYNEALEIYRRLAKDNPQAYKPNVAMTCNNLANLYSDTNRCEEAEKPYKEALEIYRRLAKDNPQAYEPYFVATCNNLANLYSDTNRCEEAEKLHKEALEIYRRLAKDNPHAFEPGVAMTLFNMGLLYKKLNKRDIAQSLHNEALEIAQKYKDTNGICRQIYEVLSSD